MKRLLTAAAFSAALFAGPASAQLYVGAGLGAADTDSSETSWKAYAGYQFVPMWGIELGYTTLGEYRGEDVDATTVAGTFTLPLSERWSFLGKLGQAWNNPGYAGAGSNTDLYAAIGVQYGFNKNLGLRLEYENFGDLSDGPGPISSGSNLALSAKYAF